VYGTRTQAALLVATKPHAANALLERIKRLGVENAESLAHHVLQIASRERPTPSELFKAYRADIAKENEKRRSDDCSKLPSLSKYLFKQMIADLDPYFVFTGQFGPAAAQRYLGKQAITTAATWNPEPPISEVVVELL
jgi:hypothetical protein